MCPTGFTGAQVLAKHAANCKGVNGRPTKIEMSERDNNILAFKNHKNKQKAPFIIYANSEANIGKIPEGEREKTSCTEKTDRHVSCGVAFTVMRSDGFVHCSRKKRQRDAAKEFLKQLLEVEKELRENLKEVAPLQMTAQDWHSFSEAQVCHICDKDLMQENFMDSVEVWDFFTGKYSGQSHKKCRCRPCAEEREVLPVRETRQKKKKKDQIDKWIT